MSAERASTQSFWRIAEPLWVGALGVQFVVVGPAVIRALIRLMGRAGQAETVEWAVHMVFLLAFLPLAWIIGWLVPRFGGVRAGNWIRRGLVIATALEGLMYLASAERPLAAAAILAGITAATALYAVSRRDDSPVSPGALSVAIGVGVFAWMSAGALVHWQSAVGWLFDLPARFIVALASVTLAAAVLHRWSTGNESLSRVPALDWAALAILGVFSFRTFPMVEFYHWSFFIGPIDQLRNGGTLLWDTPSQYGFLSILIPALLPGSSWQAFWFHQSVAYVVVAFVMYLGIRKLAAGWTGSAFALVVTFMTLFFRPRGEGWLLPAQMTPGAGPVRFVWCFVMIAFLIRHFRRFTISSDDRAFITGGTAIWAVSLLWSAETAIYVTAIWFPAYFLHTLQLSMRSHAGGASRGEVMRRAGMRIVLPFAVGAFIALAVVVGYRAGHGSGPDPVSYLDYVLLYSRSGYGALPIDPTGTIWYLVAVFLVISTVFVLHALRDPEDSRLPLWGAAWGGVWGAASYFTGRSHPSNLLSILPFLLFSLAAVLLLQPFRESRAGRYVMATVLLPLFAFPVFVVAGHESFVESVTASQLPPSQFTEQLPLMEPQLQNLLVASGAHPRDRFVFVDDGRLVLPAWRLKAGGGNSERTRMISDRSFLPRPFEIIGSLSPERRQAYFERNAARFPAGGWLVEHRSDTAHGQGHMLDFVRASRPTGRRFESADWIVSRMGPVTVPSGVTPSPAMR